ncbi:MAG: hypothetical protein CVU60_07960 [Deltaproteobacteria bacterium HGW-Deltaproteobacteria-18]|nr:MAG: hypothetical protein CVU60_07960 [Deltaproteobacteria bacterium HGW-Deltaproteobacteria-18]
MAESVSAQAPASSRIESVDMVRGIAIVLMIVGHSYDYLSYEAAAVMGSASPLPLAMLNIDATTVFIFFNRWFTHSGAPIFLFLAGVGAYLWSYKGGVKRSLGSFLIPRGLLLIALQLVRTVMQLLTSEYAASLDVLWSIGMSMILLSFFSNLPRNVLVFLSIAILVGHGLPAVFGFNGEEYVLWRVFMTADIFEFIGGTSIFNRFPVIPWFGMMLLGYATGHLFHLPPKERRNVFLFLGLSLFFVFLVLRGANVYGYQSVWQEYPETWKTVASFVNILKYPPSLYFSLVTLGTIFLFLFLIDYFSLRCLFLITIGSTSLFIYIVHLPLCKIIAVGLSTILNYMYWPISKNIYFSLTSSHFIALIALICIYPISKYYLNIKRKYKRFRIISYL